jgi:hypothetical protein
LSAQARRDEVKDSREQCRQVSEGRAREQERYRRRRECRCIVQEGWY